MAARGARTAGRACAAHRRAPTCSGGRSHNSGPPRAAFHQGLALLGWTVGRNVQTDIRWATTNTDEVRRHAAELAALGPDVILASGTPVTAALLQATHTVPIVFTLGEIGRAHV